MSHASRSRRLKANLVPFIAIVFAAASQMVVAGGELYIGFRTFKEDTSPEQRLGNGDPCSLQDIEASSPNSARLPIVQTDSVPVDGRPPADRSAGGAAVPPDGEALFRERCSKCHDAGTPGIPTRDKMAELSKADVLDVLTNGLMVDQVIGFSKAEIDALAGYVSGESS